MANDDKGCATIIAAIALLLVAIGVSAQFWTWWPIIVYFSVIAILFIWFSVWG
jgi:hypothetical protein